MQLPRYFLFGDTVAQAARIQKTGILQRINVSGECKVILDHLGGYFLEAGGEVLLKVCLHSYVLVRVKKNPETVFAKFCHILQFIFYRLNENSPSQINFCQDNLIIVRILENLQRIRMIATFSDV